jgi:hypothetical protein
MAKRRNRGRSSESSARSRRSRGGRFGTARSPRCRACGSGHGQEQTHSFLYPARDDGDDDHQQGLLRRRGNPEADGRARVPAYAHRPHDVCRPVGLPGLVSEPCPRFRVPVTGTGEVLRPAGLGPARRYDRWRRCHISRPRPPAHRARPPAHGDRQPATRESPHDRGQATARARRAGPHASVIRPGSRASTTRLEPQASDRTDPLVRSRTHYACRRNKLAIQQPRRR